MANRFLDTNFYKSPFVRSLKGSLKALYGFIICDCNQSGFWALDLEVASLYIGFQVTQDEFQEYFVDKNKAIDLGGGRYFFPDFIEHQYPKGLQEKNPAHTNVISDLKKFDLIDEDLSLHPFKYKGALKGLISPIGNGYDKEMDKDKEMDRIEGGAGETLDLAHIPLNSKTLEAAEMNQFDMTKSRNTEFVKTQWQIFLLERSNDPPTKQKDYLKHHTKLYSHFLNWLRPKKPQINGTSGKQNGNAQGGYGQTKPIAENKPGRSLSSL
jgi:hypothetical protein